MSLLFKDCKCIYTVAYIYVHHIHVHICTHMYTHVHTCAYMYIHVHMCTYMYIHVYTRTHTHIHILTHTGEKDSTVAAHVDHRTGVMTASIAVSSERYYIEPSHRHFHESHDFHMITYRASDLKYNLTR